MRIDNGDGYVMQLLRYPLYLFGKLVALGFIFFGGGVLATIIMPLTLLVPGQRRERTEFLIHNFFRFYIRMLRTFRLIRLQIDGAEKLIGAAGRMVIANHPCLLDVVILMALMPRVQCIVKHEFWDHPFLGSLVRNAGYIRNDLEPEALLASCKAAIDEGRSLIIFPEGTRTRPGTLPHFNRGFANIAILTASPIQPVFIGCNPPFLFKGEAWWRVPPETPFLHIVVGEYLDAKTYLRYGPRSIASRKIVELLELYYAKQLGNRQS